MKMELPEIRPEDRTPLVEALLGIVRELLDRNREEEAERFRRVVLRLPQVVSCHAISGEPDFLLEIVVADLNQYSEFVLKRLRRIPGVKDLHSSFALETMKAGTSLPLQGSVAA